MDWIQPIFSFPSPSRPDLAAAPAGLGPALHSAQIPESGTGGSCAAHGTHSGTRAAHACPGRSGTALHTVPAPASPEPTRHAACVLDQTKQVLCVVHVSEQVQSSWGGHHVQHSQTVPHTVPVPAAPGSVLQAPQVRD